MPGQIYIAIDPGISTGLAWTQNHQDYHVKELKIDEVPQHLIDALRGLRVVGVAVERFQGTGSAIRTPEGQATMRLVGEIIGICKALGTRCYVHDSQMMGPTYTAATEWCLEHDVPTRPPHQCDALAHLFALEELRGLQLHSPGDGTVATYPLSGKVGS